MVPMVDSNMRKTFNILLAAGTASLLLHMGFLSSEKKETGLECLNALFNSQRMVNVQPLVFMHVHSKNYVVYIIMWLEHNGNPSR